MNLNKGFSLIEISVALLILSIAITSIFQFISSTTLSTNNLEDRAFARQVASNRLALVQTIEPMLNQNKINGKTDFGGKTFFWSQRLNPRSAEFNEIIITVALDKEFILYESRVVIEY